MSDGDDAVSPAVDFSAGVVAGAVGLVVGQPFDVVKVRYQTPAFNGKYTSIFGAFRSIVQQEGTVGLFKGVTSPMAGIAFVNGVVFSSYSFFINLQHPGNGSSPTLGQITLAGTGSGMLAAFLTCPIELVKIRQQSMPIHMNPSTWSVTKDILRQGGIRGIYRGFSATLIRELAYGPYFGALVCHSVNSAAPSSHLSSFNVEPTKSECCTNSDNAAAMCQVCADDSLLTFRYEGMLRLFKWRRRRDGEDLHEKPHRHDLIHEAEAEMHTLSWPELMAAGGVAGVVAWMVTFPFDVFKTRMQSSSTLEEGSGTRKPPGLWRVATESIRREGPGVMVAGLWPTVVRRQVGDIWRDKWRYGLVPFQSALPERIPRPFGVALE
ncbi:uncharacterized protein EHS24_000318 [Apiotrichum porosum]|uniref:Carnitine transporter n=1 Tax=Apiotrichum porosum TaxID=105984 RepID=A0A427Y9H0_9TREE|nr:uncharacterized protein EHS24_000318 [Apiotrichum porosum]RSH87801.1 hypothetical protein EHS24_000318 [Apiotrichum porosum]